MTGPPFTPDDRRLYRIWFRAIKEGTETEERVVGHIRFAEDGDGWGVYVERPGDTDLYLPPGRYSRIQEAMENGT